MSADHCTPDQAAISVCVHSLLTVEVCDELDIVSNTAVFVHSEVSIPRPPRLWSEVPEGPLCCSPGGQSGLSIYVRQVRARTW